LRESLRDVEQNVGVDEPILIIGAGLSGLVAANALQQAGERVIVIDKARSAGGRLATRRMLGMGGATARLDHGAQFFTVRSPDFAELVHEWRRAGIAMEWCRGFSASADGYPRYCAEAGMNTIAKYLASTVEVVTDAQVHAVGGDDGILSAVTDGDQRWTSNRVLLTPPVPQSLTLIDNGWLPVDDDVRTSLEALTYASCVALLVTLDGPGTVREPGGMQLDVAEHDVWSFVADNQRKGISDVPALTLHANEGFSAANFHADADSLQSALLDAARPFFGNSKVVEVEVKKWRYARPLTMHADRCVTVEPVEGTRLVFAGDAFGEARVEGAVLSGLAAADALLA
jgi:renalase